MMFLFMFYVMDGEGLNMLKLTAHIRWVLNMISFKWQMTNLSVPFEITLKGRVYLKSIHS